MKSLIALIAVATAKILELNALSELSSGDIKEAVFFYNPTSVESVMVEPIWKDAVSRAEAAQLPLKFSQVNCLNHPDLCIGKDIPYISIWDTSFSHDLRPSTQNVELLYGYFQQISGSTPVNTDNSDTEGENQQGKVFTAFTQNSGIPLPIYPRGLQLTHAHGESTVLSTENFDERIVQSGEPWMIKYYSPRCPYSKAMAPEWEKYAQSGLFNIAEFDCLQNPDYCIASGISGYPTIMYIDGKFRREFVSSLAIPQWESYHQLLSGAQIIPTSDYDDLKTLVDAGASRGIASFVYLYDESTMREDWDSLVNQTSIFSNASSAVLRSDNEHVRSSIGVNFAGNGLVFAGKTVNDNNEDIPYYYTYPKSNEPLGVRDAEQVRKWVNEVRFSQPIKLDSSDLPVVNEYADVQAILITLTTRHEKFKSLRSSARHSYEQALEDQVALQKKLRETRHNLHLSLKKEGKVDMYRKVYNTPIHAPLRANISYSYISKEEWINQFGQYIDNSEHEDGDIILVNFAKGIYADRINGEKIQSFDGSILDNSDNVKSFKESIPKLSPVERHEVEFVPNYGLGERMSEYPRTNWVVAAFGLAAAGLIVVKGLLVLRTKYRGHVYVKTE